MEKKYEITQVVQALSFYSINDSVRFEGQSIYTFVINLSLGREDQKEKHKKYKAVGLGRGGRGGGLFNP